METAVRFPRSLWARCQSESPAGKASTAPAASTARVGFFRERGVKRDLVGREVDNLLGHRSLLCQSFERLGVPLENTIRGSLELQVAGASVASQAATATSARSVSNDERGSNNSGSNV